MEFLFDDTWVDRKSGVQRTLGRPRKNTEPVLKPIMPWEGDFAGSGPILFDSEEQKFKMWYRASVATTTNQDLPQNESIPLSDRNTGGQRNFVCYAESKHGFEWTRPNVGQFEFEGTRENNILFEAKGAADGPLFNVVKDPDDPDPDDPDPDDPAMVRIPNVGWRSLQVRGNAPITTGLKAEEWMYFVHSYAPMVENTMDVAATISVNGHDIPAAIARDHVVGVQFHPEKSGPAGLRLLARFVNGEAGK